MKLITVIKKSNDEKKSTSIGPTKRRCRTIDHFAFSYFSYFFYLFFFSLSRFFQFMIISHTFFTCKSGRQIQHAWQPPPHAKFKPIGLYNERFEGSHSYDLRPFPLRILFCGANAFKTFLWEPPPPHFSFFSSLPRLSASSPTHLTSYYFLLALFFLLGPLVFGLDSLAPC